MNKTTRRAMNLPRIHDDHSCQFTLSVLLLYGSQTPREIAARTIPTWLTGIREAAPSYASVIKSISKLMAAGWISHVPWTPGQDMRGKKYSLALSLVTRIDASVLLFGGKTLDPSRKGSGFNFAMHADEFLSGLERIERNPDGIKYRIPMDTLEDLQWCVKSKYGSTAWNDAVWEGLYVIAHDFIATPFFIKNPFFDGSETRLMPKNDMVEWIVDMTFAKIIYAYALAKTGAEASGCYDALMTDAIQEVYGRVFSQTLKLFEDPAAHPFMSLRYRYFLRSKPGLRVFDPLLRNKFEITGVNPFDLATEIAAKIR